MWGTTGSRRTSRWREESAPNSSPDGDILLREATPGRLFRDALEALALLDGDAQLRASMDAYRADRVAAAAVAHNNVVLPPPRVGGQWTAFCRAALPPAGRPMSR